MKGIGGLIIRYNETGAYDSERAILQWILENLDRISSCSIYTIAEETFTSTATISRLIKKLGYKGYPYFQKDISDEYRQYEYHNRILTPSAVIGKADLGEALADYLQQSVQRFREWCERTDVTSLIDDLYESPNVVFYLFEETYMKFFIQYDMFVHGKSCEAYSSLSDITSHCKDVKPGTLVVVSASQRMENLVSREVCRTAKNRGAKVCLITNSKHYADKFDVDYRFVIPGIGAAADMLRTDMFLMYVAIMLRDRYDRS